MIVVLILSILAVIVNVWPEKVVQHVVEMMTMVDIPLPIPIAIQGMNGCSYCITVYPNYLVSNTHILGID